MNVRKIGVIGAGTMGNGIAQVFAVAGYDVIMRDIKKEFVDRGMATIRRNMERMVSRNKLSAEARDAAVARIHPTIDFQTFADRDLVIEAVVEVFDVKAKLVRELDAVCGETTIFATNTSSISITKIAATSKKPERVIGMHFFNPVPVCNWSRSSAPCRRATKSPRRSRRSAAPSARRRTR